MLKKIRKEYIAIAMIIALFIAASALSFSAIFSMQGNARVVNYVGIVRGATQRLVKKELNGYPDGELEARLDSIVNNLLTGEGPHDLIRLDDETYLDYMRQVQGSWEEIKVEIEKERRGEPNQLYELSEEYFVLVDKTVSAAEEASERQVASSTTMLIVVNAVFVLILIVALVYYIRTAAIQRRADALGKIAYVDPLTQMPNRAACEQLADKYQNEPPAGDLAVFMFDMNNLKRVNDQLGHQGGDRIIADFARIVKGEAADFGFAARYGGDEFIAIFENADEEMANRYLAKLNEKLVSYNILHVNELEKISFAAGYVVDNLANTALEAMINEADKRMYIRKRQMKENREA